MPKNRRDDLQSTRGIFKQNTVYILNTVNKYTLTFDQKCVLN